MNTPDTNYGKRPWSQTLKRANPTYEDATTSSALAAAMDMTADQIRAVRPSIPVTLFPPKYGYDRSAFSINDIVRLNDLYQRVDFTGRQSGYSGTSYPSLNQF